MTQSFLPIVSAWNFFRRAPIFFTLLQLPCLLLNFLQNAFFPDIETWERPKQFAVAIPLASVELFIMVISLCFTFWGIESLKNGTAPSFSASFSEFKKFWIPLLSASAMLILVFLMGIAAYFVPFLILMGLYLYVPLFIVDTSASEPRSIWIAFNRSSQLAKKHWGKVALLVFINFALMAAGFFSPSPKDSAQPILMLIINLGLGVLGALYALLVACQFKTLKSELGYPL